MKILLLISVLIGSCFGDCPIDLEVEDRIDCYPWPGVTEELCNDINGCEWCESEPGVPWCIRNPEACPSKILATDRVDCFALSQEECTNKDCAWCPSDITGVPWCFQDSTITMGGETCPTDNFFISDNERVDCTPEKEAEAETCTQRGCYWCESEVEGAPWCFAPKTQGYVMDSEPEETEKGWRINLSRRTYPTWFGGDLIHLTVDVEFQTNDRLRVKVYDRNNTRFEVPINIPSPSTKAEDPKYEIIFFNEPAFNFKILRKDTGLMIFDTSIGGLQFADQFLQIGAYLPTEYVYGFGETEHHSFKHNMGGYNTWPMYARDQPTSLDNGYGVHPYFQAFDENNDMFGVLFLNSNAQEVDLIPAPGVVYRTIGGIIDFYFFLGPTPEEVTQQYTEAIGRPIMPPYWALGFHLSRYGYEYLEVMNETVQRNREAGIPIDVLHGDIDYMYNYIIFTYDQDRFAGLPEYVQDIKANDGIHFITILDPFLPDDQPWYEPFIRGDEMGAFVRDSDGNNAIGKAWPPGTCVYGDYFNPDAHTWWVDECTRFHEIIEFDGLWIDMNEPASFVHGSTNGCDYNKINNPLYKPRSVLGDVLHDKTLCSDYVQNRNNHYDVHSLYGWSMSSASLSATRTANEGKRSYVFGRSTYPGAGQYVGHWLGDNWSKWPNLAYSIIGMLEFNYFGIPYVGADICGFLEDSNEELCARWQQVGAFYGFSRNHNGFGWIEQDPAVWEGGRVAETSKWTLEIRYTLLPYLYTLFHNAHVFGNTVIRPLLNVFPGDDECKFIDKQFLWGSGFMISPVLTENTFEVSAYFPDQRWYSYHDGVEVPVRGDYITLDCPWNFINLHVRGGLIIPTQQHALSTVYSRVNPMGLIVALDDEGSASGEMFWDDGDTLDTYEKGLYMHTQYSVESSTLTGSITFDGYNDNLFYSTIRIFGSGPVSQVLVHGEPHSAWTQDTELLISELNLPTNIEFTVSWS